jgi:hypothetical protein
LQVWLQQPQVAATDSRFDQGDLDVMVVDSPSKKMSRYARPSPFEPVRWTERRRQLLLLTLKYRVITREIAQLRLYTRGARSQVQRDLTHLWRTGILSKISGRASTACDVYEVSRASPRGLRHAEVILGKEALKERLRRPPALEHALMVNELRARLEVSFSAHGIDLTRWLDELDLSNLGGYGITPDGFAEAIREDRGRKRRSGFLVEVEVAPVSRAHWRKRLRSYRSFYYSGKYTEVFGLRSLRLLVVASGGDRQAAGILAEADVAGFSPLRLTTFQEIRNVAAEDIIWACLWRKAADQSMVSLFDTIEDCL